MQFVAVVYISALDLKASDVVRQPKIADMSRVNPDSASRLRSTETGPDGVYSRNSADGDTVSIGIEWAGGDVRFACDNMCY